MNTIEVATVNSAVCNQELLLIFFAHIGDTKKKNLSSQNEYFIKYLDTPTLQKSMYLFTFILKSKEHLIMYSSDTVYSE